MIRSSRDEKLQHLTWYDPIMGYTDSMILNVYAGFNIDQNEVRERVSEKRLGLAMVELERASYT